MKQGATIFDISRILNISPSTVSRALKNHPDISAPTRQRVLDLAKTMDYEPNQYAIGLRTTNTNEFGVIVPNLSGFSYNSFISALEQEARKIGYSLIVLVCGDDPQVEVANIKICKQRRVEGIFICTTSPITDNLQNQRIPVMFFDEVPEGENINTVCADDYGAAQLCAETLTSKSNEKILGIFGNRSTSVTRKRFQAFTEHFESRHLADQLDVQYALSSNEAFQIAYQHLSKNKPDAVFCMNDEILVGTMKAIQMLKLSVPQDVGIISISNGFFPKLYYPDITYVETNESKLGMLALENMLQLMAEKPVAETQVPAVLVPGGSL